MRAYPLFLILLLVGCSPPPTTEITQRDFRVLRVIDGDTFTGWYDGEETSVRLAAFDAPAPGEEGGPEAKAALEKLILGKVVRLEFPGPRKRDHFGRLRARVSVEGKTVNPSVQPGPPGSGLSAPRRALPDAR